MTKKAETQFALLAAAFTADEQMARQVCGLLANGHIDEPAAKMMLALVRDGHLKSITTPMWRPVTYPYVWASGTTISPPTTTPYRVTCDTNSLTSMAQALTEAA